MLPSTVKVKRSGRPRSTRMNEVIEQARLMTANPVRINIAKLLRQLAISRRSGEKLVKENLKSYLERLAWPIMRSSADKQIMKTKTLLNWIKNGPNSNKVQIFSLMKNCLLSTQNSTGRMITT